MGRIELVMLLSMRMGDPLNPASIAEYVGTLHLDL
jgi:hypothetical protein